MASLEESLVASAMEALNIEDYWPTYDSNNDINDDDDSEYSIILYFYEELLNHLMARNGVRDLDLQQAIGHLVYNYSHVNNGKTPQELDYDRLHNCLGYLHRYAACHTALVVSVMVRMFHKCPPVPVRRMLALKDCLNILCLGGGPGNDLVGLLSALYGKHFGLTKLDLTVVDKSQGWDVVFQETVRRLRLGECGNASKVFREIQEVSSSFSAGDLTRPVSGWSPELKRKFASADLVLLSKVLSVVPNSEKPVILKNVVTTMKPGSLLVFIDCPFPTADFAALTKYLDTAYEACKEKFNFNFEVKRFDFPNITTSRAYVRLFVRKFIVDER
ncbi:hypothetical protein JTE90_006152 [Oedothorax gibbosus]|uniref:Uncharacterized protein n=1 Tax=Oedothorax gibbosus TaxID=931172 RepID=A0AAV6U5D2_9ARAC|nr:hypothetical protein JTE90_006152 [Oedothorax gibbosus]